jgi:hypothetical protein
MVAGRDIICFGDDWGRHPQVLEHLVRILARENRVLWVNSLGHRAPRLRGKDLIRMAEKIRSATQGTEVGEKNISVLRPLGLPWHDSRIVRKLNGFLLGFALRRRMRSLSFSSPILLTNSPVMHEVIGTLGETVTVYYCLDDYAAFDGALRTMKSIEQELLSKIDVAFYVTEHLLRQKKNQPQHASVMPQPVNFEHFTHPRHAAAPDPFPGVRRPIIGYVGLVETVNWLDLPLLAEVARRRPEWSFILIGPVQTDVAPYAQLRNLTFLGPIPYSEIPRYMLRFDVGLIPRKINEVTTACNPIKLLEYFSLGLPVVSTPLPAVEQFGELVAIAATPDELERRITEVLSASPQELRTKRVGTAERLSWSRVAQEQFGVIEKAERERYSRRGSGKATGQYTGVTRRRERA